MPDNPIADQLAQQRHAEQLAEERRRMAETGLTRQQLRAGAETDAELLAELRAKVEALEAKERERKPMIGKDGIKVAGHIIGLDGPLPGAQGDQQQLYEYSVNVIENGVLRVRTFYITENEEEA